MRRRAAWAIVAIGAFLILEAAMFTWWSRPWTSGATQFAAGAGCIYGGIALLRLEPFRGSHWQKPSSRPPRGPV